MTLRTTGPIFGLMSLRTINLSGQWPFGLLTIRTNGMIFGPMTLRTTDLSDYWPFGLVHDFRTNEPSDQRPFGISSCPQLPCWIVLVSNAIIIIKACLATAWEQSVSTTSQWLMPDIIDDVTIAPLFTFWNLLKTTGFHQQDFHSCKASQTLILPTTSDVFQQWISSQVTITS